MGDKAHVAIIMDGNGRWACSRGLERTEGHRKGVRVAADIVEAAVDLDVASLTLYAFSSDNWKRPETEVRTLMDLMLSFLREETPRCRDKGVALQVIGRRDRLSPEIREGIEQAEEMTAGQDKMRLRVAIDYSARDAIAAAAARYQSEIAGRELFETYMSEALNAAGPIPQIDLLIRTGGEQRLSDFLLWECAYAELLFVDTFWPDYTPEAFGEALAELAKRNRRFGTVPVA